MKDGTSAGKKDFLRSLRAIVIGAASGALVCVLLLAAFSLLFTAASSIPQSMLPVLVLVIACVGAFAGGIISVLVSGQNGLICGAMTGLLLFLLFLAAGMVFENGSTAPDAAIRLGAMMLAGGIGGLLAINRRTKRK